MSKIDIVNTHNFKVVVLPRWLPERKKDFLLKRLWRLPMIEIDTEEEDIPEYNGIGHIRANASIFVDRPTDSEEEDSYVHLFTDPDSAFLNQDSADGKNLSTTLLELKNHISAQTGIPFSTVIVQSIALNGSYSLIYKANSAHLFIEFAGHGVPVEFVTPAPTIPGKYIYNPEDSILEVNEIVVPNGSLVVLKGSGETYMRITTTVLSVLNWHNQPYSSDVYVISFDV